MIDFQQVSKSYADQAVLSEVSFRINPGEQVGIVGPNGAGKSTIFALIAGELGADRGDVESEQEWVPHGKHFQLEDIWLETLTAWCLELRSTIGMAL